MSHQIKTTGAIAWVLLFTCLAAMPARAGFFQQGILVSGIVTDDKNNPLAGVTVSVKGESAATVTAADGRYRLTVSNRRAVLVFSFVGFETVSQTVGSRTTLDLALKPSAARDLDEVVVIGYGTVKKRDLTGAVTSVKAADIVRSPTGNALEAIQGMVPGADITRSSGKANAGANVLIRGTRTVSGNTKPLYIIDGIQGDSSANNLNPNDIESIEVLKDASSTAIYGSQGANGVIIITTKKGVAGKMKVNYDGYYGVDGWAQYPMPRTADSYIQLRREAYRTTGVWSSPANDPSIFSSAEKAAIAAGQWVNWVDLLLKNGTRQNHSLSLSGGTDKTKAYFSAGYYRDEGMVRFNNLAQYNVLLNVDQHINNWMKAGLQGRFVYSNANTRGSDPFSRATTNTPLGKPYDSLGNINVYPLSNGLISPLADDRGRYIATNNNIQNTTSFNAHIDLDPIKGLSFRSIFGVNIANGRTGQYYDSSSIEEVNQKQSYAAIVNENTRFYNWDNILNYNKSIGDHSFGITALSSYTHSNYETMTGAGTGLVFSSQLFYSLAGTAAANRTLLSNYVQTANMSYAGRINYSYKGRYLLTLTERIDKASVLSVGHKSSAFPSVAAGWRISDEDFMKKTDWVSNLKLRASYGVTGNSGIRPYGTQSTLTTQSMGFENTAAPAYIFGNLVGNASLGWELSRTVNIGLDMGFFKNRLNITADVYNTNTSDILLLRNLPPNLGVASVYQNIGSSRNRGIELAITSRNIDNRNFQWTSTLNFMSNQEKITGLINGTNIIDPTNAEVNSLLLGHPIHSFYNFVKQGIWQTADSGKASAMTFNGTPFAPGYIKLEDINHDNKIMPDSDRVFIGATVPKWSFGFMNSFVYRGIDLNIYIFARWGQMIKADVLGRYNPAGEGNNGPAYFDYWTPENPTNDYPRPRQNTNLAYYPGYSTLNYVDGSYIKLKTVSLGYTFPASMVNKWKLDRLRVYITANNIFVWNKNHLLKYYDPERGGSEDAPLTRQLVFGLNVGL